MITLSMNEGNAMVKRDGIVLGHIGFVGESETGEYVFLPREKAGILRSGELTDIARQVGLLNLDPAFCATAEAPTHYGFTTPDTKSSGAEPRTKAEPCLRCGEIDLLLNVCGKCVQALVRKADSFKTEATAEPTETKTKGDIAADAIITAFDGDEYLADSDLLKASGLKRSEYVQVRDYLLYTSNELVEMEAEEDGITVYSYAKPRKQAAA